jgi:hypothetical protein
MKIIFGDSPFRPDLSNDCSSDPTDLTSFLLQRMQVKESQETVPLGQTSAMTVIQTFLTSRPFSSKGCRLRISRDSPFRPDLSNDCSSDPTDLTSFLLQRMQVKESQEAVPSGQTSATTALQIPLILRPFSSRGCR